MDWSSFFFGFGVCGVLVGMLGLVSWAGKDR